MGYWIRAEFHVLWTTSVNGHPHHKFTLARPHNVTWGVSCRASCGCGKTRLHLVCFLYSAYGMHTWSGPTTTIPVCNEVVRRMHDPLLASLRTCAHFSVSDKPLHPPVITPSVPQARLMHQCHRHGGAVIHSTPRHGTWIAEPSFTAPTACRTPDN